MDDLSAVYSDTVESRGGDRPRGDRRGRREQCRGGGDSPAAARPEVISRSAGYPAAAKIRITSLDWSIEACCFIQSELPRSKPVRRNARRVFASGFVFQHGAPQRHRSLLAIIIGSRSTRLYAQMGTLPLNLSCDARSRPAE